MRKSRRYLAIGALSAALVSLVAYAAQPSQPSKPRAPSMEKAATAAASAQPRAPGSVWEPPRRPVPFPTFPSTPTRDEVGDTDSFGRPLKWLGVTSANVYLSPDCAASGRDESECKDTGEQTWFSFPETGASITLPGNAAHSLLCHWFSPVLMIEYQNPLTEPVTASLQYVPRLRIESEVLRDPGLVDQTTGQPFNGSLMTSMSSGEHLSTVLLATESRQDVMRDTNTCIAGFLTRLQLVETYGLTEAQAAEVFRKPMTIRMEVHAGFASYVSNAQLTLGLRILGD